MPKTHTLSESAGRGIMKHRRSREEERAGRGRSDTGSRNLVVEALDGASLDVLVVGGGIVGACAALDAASRGMAVGLVDRGDFGGGATANCLKIVHGGLRYLQHADLRRMRESIEERSIWLRSAPHLVEPLPVVMPTYRRRFPPRWALAVALAINEAVSVDRNRALDPDRVIPLSRVLSRGEVGALVPELEANQLTGGILFHDAIMYSPERLTLEVLAAARAAGAHTANHVELEAPIVAGGRVTGARLRDRITSSQLEVRARWIINATGSAVPHVAARLVGRTPTRESAPASAIRYSVALNLVTRQPARRTAFTIAAGAPDPDRVVRSGPRQLFVVPWRGQSLVGTAHLPYDGDPAGFAVTDEHVETFLAEVAGATPGLGLDRDQVALVHGGLLPVAEGAGGAGVRLLKRHRIIDHAADGVAGALSVVSVKFTTARRVAAEAVARIAGDRRRRPARTRPTRLQLPGAPAGTMAGLATEAHRRHGDLVAADVLDHLLRSYGARYEQVLDHRHTVAGWDDRVVPGAPVIHAQLVHGAVAELARTVDDLLWRRTELGARGLVTPAARERAERVLATLGRGVS
jgi:glycerol-3-phosphate dehydrogenase